MCKLSEADVSYLPRRLGFTDDGGRAIEYLTDYQARVVSAILKREHRRYCIVASTQVGKSTAVLVAALASAIKYSGEEIWIISPSYSQAVSKFQYIKRAVESNPRLRMFIDFSKPFRRDAVHFRNGSVIRCLSAGARRGLVGYSATMLIVDEAQEISDEIWRTRLLRMVAGSGMKQPPVVVLIGTANRVNFFRDAFLADDWWKTKITWREGVAAGILRQEIVEYARKTMSESEFKAWFEAEFETPAGKAFNITKMRELMTLGRPLKGFELGAWRIFAGLDVARFGEDESCLVLIRMLRGVEWGEVPAEMMFYETRAKKSLADVIGWVAKNIEEYDIERVAIDETAIGAGVYDVLRERFGGRVMGVRFAGNERENVYGALVDAIDNGYIRLLKDDEILRQAERFSIEYTVDGRPRVVKARGMRDDIIDALALAVYAASRPMRGRAVPLIGFEKVFG